MAAAFATWRFRTSQQSRSQPVKVTVMLLLLAVVSVPGVVWLASLLGLAGA